MSEEGRAITTHLCVVTDTYAPEINGVALTLARLINGAAPAMRMRS